ncbi:MAG TPA: DNA recombination protein RmuC, partial [Erysipelothrix sp.]|nr:DNA recombination protein RmuC [Erysipelothrix sp.]
ILKRGIHMQEILIIILLISQIILILALFILKQNQSKNHRSNLESIESKNQQLIDRLDLRFKDVLERNTNFERHSAQNMQQFNENLTLKLNEYFKLQSQSIERRLNHIDLKVNESLEEGFQKTANTFTNIVERLTKIDEAQKKIDKLSVEIVSLQDVLIDKSARGAFGEIQLNQILSSVFGEKNDRIYQTQYTFSNNRRTDAVLFAPEPLGTIAIDSKFPLETYRALINENPQSQNFKDLSKQFENDIKKHIDDIKNRYIIHEETSDQAMMFIPAEAIFAYINAYHPHLVTYAQKHRVWLTSPTTLMSTLTTIQTILVNMERDKYTKEIQNELKHLEVEFDRYKTRWDRLSRRLDQVGNDVKEIHTTTDKITKRFETITNIEED